MSIHITMYRYCLGYGMLEFEIDGHDELTVLKQYKKEVDK